MSASPETPKVTAEALGEALHEFIDTTQRITQLQIAIAGAARFIDQRRIDRIGALVQHNVELNMSAIGSVVNTLGDHGVYIHASDKVFGGRFSGVTFDANQVAYQLYVAESPEVMHALPYTDQVELSLDVSKLNTDPQNQPSPYV